MIPQNLKKGDQMADENPKVTTAQEQTQIPFMTPAQGAAPVLPTETVGHVALALTASEFLFALARSRVAMVPGPKAPIPQSMQEYFLTLAISPTTAKNLLNSLTQAVQIYEERFGKIPVDPKVRLQTTGVTTETKPKS